MPIHWGGFILACILGTNLLENQKIAEERGLNCLTPKIGSILSKETLDKNNNAWWEKILDNLFNYFFSEKTSFIF